jgi:SAM-dependent methyltransferase
MSGYALELDPAEIGRYRMMAERAQAAEASQWAAAGIGPGARVADVGCGPGAITALLAEAVGPTGSVVGVDGNASTIAAARELVGAGNVEFSVAPADETALAEASFDVVMLRHVLAHNGGREEAIVEHLATLVRPGGCVYLVDVDLSAVNLYPSNDDLEDLMSRYVDFHSQLGNNPKIGLQLQHLLLLADLDIVDFTGRYDILSVPPGVRPPSWAARDAMVAAGIADADDVERWRVALEATDTAAERPLVFASVFVAIGRRPLDAA